MAECLIVFQDSNMSFESVVARVVVGKPKINARENRMAIKNGQSTDTDNIRHTRRRQNTNTTQYVLDTTVSSLGRISFENAGTNCVRNLKENT
jgi:hypothetical protein